VKSGRNYEVLFKNRSRIEPANTSHQTALLAFEMAFPESLISL